MEGRNKRKNGCRKKQVCVCDREKERECVKETNTYFQVLLQPREFDTVVSLILVLIIMPKFSRLVLFLLKLYNLVKLKQLVNNTTKIIY